MAAAYTPAVSGSGLKAGVQRLGGHLAGMVMPNIGAFIAWGLVTALFIPTGWLPNKHFGELVDPTFTGPAVSRCPAPAHRGKLRPGHE